MNKINVTELDAVSISVLHHLQDAYQQYQESNNDSGLDATLISNYIRVLSNDKSLVFPGGKANNGTIELVKDNTFLIEFVPLLSNLLELPLLVDNYNLITELLHVILSYLSFDQISYFYPHDYILRGVEATAPNVLNLIISIFDVKLSDNGLVLFIQSSDVLDTLLFRYLSVTDSEYLALSVVNRIEKLIDRIVELKITPILQAKLLSAKSIKLYETTKQNKNQILNARLLDLIVLLVPILDGTSLPESLFDFDEAILIASDYDDDDFDPLYPKLLILFYQKCIQKLETGLGVFAELTPAIDKLVKIYSIKSKYPLVDGHYATDIIDLIVTISNSGSPDIRGHMAALAKQLGLLKPYNLELSNPADQLLLLRINFTIFDKDTLEGFYEDMLADAPLLNSKYFDILLNSIKSEVLFNLIATSSNNYLTNERISRLSQDLVYYLLLELSKHDYSSTYLVNHLPNIISNYITNSPYEVSNSMLWNIKLKILTNLLFEREHVDLNIWEIEMKKTYNLMKNGQNIRLADPNVDVLDEFAWVGYVVINNVQALLCSSFCSNCDCSRYWHWPISPSDWVLPLQWAPWPLPFQ